MFAMAYMGRKRWAAAPTIALTRSTARVGNSETTHYFDTRTDALRRLG